MLAKQQSDEDLVRNYLDTQKDEFFEQLYNRYVSKVYRRCLSITKDPYKAEDFTQDIFLKAMSNLKGFRERSSFSTWLYSISTNYCMDQVKLAKRLPTVELNVEITHDVSEPLNALSPDEQAAAIQQVLATLKPDELECLKLKYYENLDIREIALKLQLSDSAVKMRLKRTRDKLRKTFDEVCMV